MIHKLHHNLWEPACSVNIVPSLVGNSLLITIKMVKAGYMTIYDDKEVNFYDTTTTKKKTPHVLPNTPTPPPHESKKDIFIRVYKLKKTMYSD